MKKSGKYIIPRNKKWTNQERSALQKSKIGESIHPLTHKLLHKDLLNGEINE